MDMLHQLPGALYRLRSARLPLRPFTAPQVCPAVNRFGTGINTRSVSCSSSLLHANGHGLESDCKGLLNNSELLSRPSSGFRVYFGKRGWNRSLGQRNPSRSGYDGRSLSVVAAAARSSNSKAQEDVDVPLGFSGRTGDGELDKPSPKQPARSKRQVRSQVDSGRASRSSQSVNRVTVSDSSRWRFEPRKNQAEGEEQRLQEDSARLGLKSASLRAKNPPLRQSSGRIVSLGGGGGQSKRGSKPSRITDVWTNSYITKAGNSSVSVRVETKESLVVEAKATQRGTSVSKELSETMSPNQKMGEKDRKPKQNVKKKEKHFPAEAVLRRDLNMCSKGGDVLKALELYDQSVKDRIVKWNQYNFNILLYLCSSASLGTLTARKSGSDRAELERLRFNATEQIRNGEGPEFPYSEIEELDRKDNGEAALSEEGATSASTSIVLSPEVMETVATRGFEIYEHMKRLKVPPNEATLTAVARLAVAKGDGDLAFQMVKEMGALNLAPKLRSYSPALFTYCKNKAVKEAFEVDAHMVGAGVHPEEPELAGLLQLCVDAGLADEVYKLLHRLRVRVRALSPTTVAAIEEWFKNEASAKAGEENEQPGAFSVQQAMVSCGGGWHGLGWLGEGEWKQEWSKVDKEGVCLSCKEKLVTIDLDPEETENFAESLAELASTREAKPNDFKKFQEWLEHHGPFDTIVDGANIGLFNQNFAQGGFNFFQLNAVVTSLQDQGLAKKPPLIFLHHARTKFGAANTPQAQQLLNKWRSLNSIYTTPNGSNDDWYWMYAAVKNKCLLVTNDEMRDHLFQLLGTDFFPKWKERHQVRFSCTTRGPQFHLPPPYSVVIQESENGSWHIPKIGGDAIDAQHEWLCVTRPGLRTAQGTSPALEIPETETAVETVVELSSPSKSPMLEVEKQQTTLPEPQSPGSGTEDAGVRKKRARLHPPSTTIVKITAAEKRSENGLIAFEI